MVRLSTDGANSDIKKSSSANTVSVNMAGTSGAQAPGKTGGFSGQRRSVIRPSTVQSPSISILEAKLRPSKSTRERKGTFSKDQTDEKTTNSKYESKTTITKSSTPCDNQHNLTKTRFPTHNGVKENSSKQKSETNSIKEENPEQDSNLNPNVSVKQPWNLLRKKLCPITYKIVMEGRGQSLRSSILEERKFSFKNLKLTKATTVKFGNEAVKLKEVTSTKAFEDRANNILSEIRKQRRSLHLEYNVGKVNVAAPSSGWRDTISKAMDSTQQTNKIQFKPVASNDNFMKVESKSIEYKSQARNVNTKSPEKENLPPVSARSNNVQSKSDIVATPSKVGQRAFNPLDFILMKEEFVKNNPPPKSVFVKDRSVESEKGTQSMESVMASLKKIVKTVNPKREFLSDIRLKEEEFLRKKEAEEKARAELKQKIADSTGSWSNTFERRMRFYRGAAITPYSDHASKWNNMEDMRRREEERAIARRTNRIRVFNKVLSSISIAKECKLERNNHFVSHLPDFAHKSFNIKPTQFVSDLAVAVREDPGVLEATEYRKRDLTNIIAHFNKETKSKKKMCSAKPCFHGASKSDETLNHGLIVRWDVPMGTVKPINLAVKKKTEMFSSNLQSHVPGRAKVSVEGLYIAIITSPGTVGIAKFSEQDRWENKICCALFGIIPQQEKEYHTATLNRVSTICLAKEAVLESEEKETQFEKCERKPQSQLVKDMLAMNYGSLSRISFHSVITFSSYDIVMIIIRFLRTKKHIDRLKWKQEEKIYKMKVAEILDEKKDDEEKFLSYGTV